MWSEILTLEHIEKQLKFCMFFFNHFKAHGGLKCGLSHAHISGRIVVVFYTTFSEGEKLQDLELAMQTHQEN